ncbi:hypothetical protein Ddc_21168 [Ditylenchus destructor]|nr:hypothetical protein Ddc_21168 [Ditylenchus destructor]
MHPFLDKTVRVAKVNIWICHSTIMKLENIDQLKSLSHVWENAQVKFTTGRYSKANLASRAKLLSEAKLFCCRRFKCSYRDVMLPLWEYPEIYSLEVVKLKLDLIEEVEYDLTPIIKLVENRALYPHSQTTFVLTGSSGGQVTRGGNLPRITNDVIQNIGKKLFESDKAQCFRIICAVYLGSNFHLGNNRERLHLRRKFDKTSFQIIIPVKERFELSDAEMEEFRLQNNRTQGRLYFRRLTGNQVAKYCQFDAKRTYFVLGYQL